MKKKKKNNLHSSFSDIQFIFFFLYTKKFKEKVMAIICFITFNQFELMKIKIDKTT